jgi:uncharacterized protein YbjT (DUF2867 family)
MGEGVPMRVLVTGATGNVGRLVVDHLVRAGGVDVRAVTADPARAALPPEVEVVEGFVGRLESVVPALTAVDKVYLAPHPPTAADVTAAIADAGVRHVVDLGGLEGTEWRDVEAAVEASGVAWTHLEPGEFMANALVWARQIRTAGEVREAYPTAASAPIDLDEVAAVAAEALTGEGHEGRRYELTGPESLTRAEQVARIGAALGRDVACVRVSRDDAVAALQPELGEYAGWYVDGLAGLAEHPQRPLDTVPRVTGRPATTFATWAKRNADAFR